MSTFGVAGHNGHSSNSSNTFEDYFSSTATFSGARRLLHDVGETRRRYESEWQKMSLQDRDQAVNDAVIDPRVAMKYDDKSDASRVFPRLRQKTGQARRVLLVEDPVNSQGEDNADSASSSGCTYTYQDEHSAPFSFRTRSQQDLALEVGYPEPLDDRAMEEAGLERVAQHQPSRILTRSIDYVRQSRGNPSFAKAVSIPVAPEVLHKMPERPPRRDSYNGVPPEQINNFVYETSPNRVVLDFGDLSLTNGGDHDNSNNIDIKSNDNKCNTLTSVDSSLSSGSAKVFSKMKRSIAHKSATLTRRSKRKTSNSQTSPNANPHTRKSTSDLMSASYHESTSRPTITAPTALRTTAPLAKIIKPSVAPPPPPVSNNNSSNPTAIAIVAPMKKKEEETESAIEDKPKPPPIPPLRKSSKISSAFDDSNNHHPSASTSTIATLVPNEKEDLADNGEKIKEDEKSTKEDLEDFKIDLTTGEDLPKTGFDFLDNW